MSKDDPDTQPDEKPDKWARHIPKVYLPQKEDTPLTPDEQEERERQKKMTELLDEMTARDKQAEAKRHLGVQHGKWIKFVPGGTVKDNQD